MMMGREGDQGRSQHRERPLVHLNKIGARKYSSSRKWDGR